MSTAAGWRRFKSSEFRHYIADGAGATLCRAIWISPEYKEPPLAGAVDDTPLNCWRCRHRLKWLVDRNRVLTAKLKHAKE